MQTYPLSLSADALQTLVQTLTERIARLETERDTERAYASLHLETVKRMEAEARMAHASYAANLDGLRKDLNNSTEALRMAHMRERGLRADLAGSSKEIRTLRAALEAAQTEKEAWQALAVDRNGAESPYRLAPNGLEGGAYA